MNLVEDSSKLHIYLSDNLLLLRKDLGEINSFIEILMHGFAFTTDCGIQWSPNEACDRSAIMY